MFYASVSFNSDLSGWDVSAVTSMEVSLKFAIYLPVNIYFG